MDVVNLIEQLSVKLNNQTICEQLKLRLRFLDEVQTRIVITGGSNVGKTSLINAITGTKLDESPLPTNNSIKVVFNNCKNDAEARTIIVENEWMAENNLVFWELSELGLSEESTQLEYGIHFINADVCVFLVNAVAALSRTEMNQLNALNAMGIPTLLVVSKGDQLTQVDLDEVMSYIPQKTSKFNNIELLKLNEPCRVTRLAPAIKEKILKLLKEVSPKDSSRAALANLFIIDALTSLFSLCKENMDKIEFNKEKIEKVASDKLSKLSDQTTIWLKIQNEMIKRKENTLQRISDTLEKKKVETIRQLKHNVEICQDVKMYWEKELPYRLEDIVRANAQAGSQIISADILSTINWLNVEVKRSFNKKLNAIEPISCTIESQFIPPEDIEIADNRKMRIVARVGTAATVIAAGTMCATMGIGGVVMAVSMLAGVGAEFFMGRKQDEAKAKVLELIPRIVEQAHGKVVIDISDNLDKVYNELLKSIHSYQDTWTEEAEKEIDKEKRIALFNCNSDATRWNECMQEIDALSLQFE